MTAVFFFLIARIIGSQFVWNRLSREEPFPKNQATSSSFADLLSRTKERKELNHASQSEAV